MPIEKNYDFRNRMRDYFLREIRRDNVSVNPGELQLDETWQICCTDPANELLNRAAFDLARFLERASGIRLSGSGDKKIIIRAGSSSGAPGCRFSVPRHQSHR